MSLSQWWAEFVTKPQHWLFWVWVVGWLLWLTLLLPIMSTLAALAALKNAAAMDEIAKNTAAMR